MSENPSKTQSIRALPGLVEDLTKRMHSLEKDNLESKIWQARMSEKADHNTTLLKDIKDDLRAGITATNETVDEQGERISTLENKASESKGRFWGIATAASIGGGGLGAFFAKYFERH
jgi:hypothetical protein